MWAVTKPYYSQFFRSDPPVCCDAAIWAWGQESKSAPVVCHQRLSLIIYFPPIETPLFRFPSRSKYGGIVSICCVGEKLVLTYDRGDVRLFDLFVNPEKRLPPPSIEAIHVTNSTPPLPGMFMFFFFLSLSVTNKWARFSTKRI
jgi:hypothetical protein